jgi:hypothetical protein
VYIKQRDYTSNEGLYANTEKARKKMELEAGDLRLVQQTAKLTIL